MKIKITIKIKNRTTVTPSPFLGAIVQSDGEDDDDADDNLLDDWISINARVPRLVSVLPNGPVHHPTVRVFLAGGVPEVMLHLRRLGLLNNEVLTVTGKTLGENLDASGSKPGLYSVVLFDDIAGRDQIDKTAELSLNLY